MRIINRLVTKLHRSHACWRERTREVHVTRIDPPIGPYTHMVLWDDR